MKILASVPLPFDATSYYRAFGIFPNLRKQLGEEMDITLYQGRKFTWAELLPFDILFLQRPSNPDLAPLVKYCKNLGIKIWIDQDDNLFALPPYNRVHDTITPKVKASMLEMLKMADVVTVSTKALKEFFATLGVGSQVVPNALNTDLTPMAKEYNSPDVIENYIWRGSDTHLADLYFFQEELRNALDKRKKTHWDFIGFNPWFVTMDNEPEKWKYHMSEDIMVYYEKLKKLRPQVMHVPLIPDGLNSCKSNIAWIEATAAGAVCIAPDWEEWKKPGIYNYDSIEKYGEILNTDLLDRPTAWAASRDYILENLTLQKVNQQRVSILGNLMEQRRGGGNYELGMSNLPATMIE